MTASLPSRFELAAKVLNLPPYEAEHRFHAKRRWRFDYAWPAVKVAVEIEGGIWNKSRHTTAKGYSNDCEKYNHAAAAGWVVIRLTEIHMKDSVKWVEFIGDVIKKRKE